MNIVITGASKGIGYETAKLLASNPDNSVVAIARDKELLNRLKETCVPSASLIPVCFDLSGDYNKFENELGPLIFNHMEKVDVLINNAGYLVNKSFADMDSCDVEEIFQVNVFGVMSLIKLLSPHMGGATKSHIVNIGSMGGFQGSKKFPGLAAYSASKGALSILSECLAEEFNEKNIAVNCLAIGSVNTEMLNKAFPGLHSNVEPVQMARYIAKFCEEGKDLINGKVVPVSLSL